MKTGQTIRHIQEVNSELVQEVVRRIVERVRPEKIILFGSYAYGHPHRESDLDILVVMRSAVPRYKRSIPVYDALAGLLIPKDILVYTPDEVVEWNSVPQAFITAVMQKGRIVYEKQG